VSTYLFALVDGGGTVPPELAAARRLVDNGHRVEVLAEDSMRDEVLATGAAFRPWERGINRPDRLPEHDVLRDWECRTPLQLFKRMLDTVLAGPAPGYAADLLAVADAHPPDTVVCSFFSIGAMVAAEAAGIPYVVLMANIYGLPAAGLPPFGTGGKPPTGRLGGLRDRAVTALVARQWNKGLDRINALRKTYGLRPLGDFWDQVRRARKILVLTSPAFDFPADVPDNVRYVGPVLDDPSWAVGGSWAPPPGDGPVVLVAMSTTPQDQVDCLQRAIDALSALPVRGIVTTGPSVDPKVLQPSQNVSVVASAPHSEVLKCTSVVVTHGGHGTVIRSLAAGVPLVVMPQGRDQADNAARLESRGAAVTIKSSASATTIGAAVKRVLEDPSFSEGARRLGQAIRADAASDTLVSELER
jgi:MGT family glycosyltransferase